MRQMLAKHFTFLQKGQPSNSYISMSFLGRLNDAVWDVSVTYSTK